MRPMFALPEMVGTALNRPANTLVTDWVSTVRRVSPGVARRFSATVVVADVVPSISTTPQTATSVITTQASIGNEMPQCSGCGKPIQAASETDEKSTIPMATLIANPAAMPMSGAAPLTKPFPNTLSISTTRKVTPASTRLTGSPKLAAPLPPAQFASALPISPVPSTSRTAPDTNDGNMTLSQSENSTNTTPQITAATMQAPI